MAVAAHTGSRRTLFSLTTGHLTADLCAGALWALLPYLVVERHYSYAAAGVFALVISVTHAAVQPLVGAQGDRWDSPPLLGAGLIVTGIGMAVVGFVYSFPLTLLAAALCSAGVAAYHPEAARWARRAAGARVALDMSLYSVGGSAGYALGPLVVAAVLTPLGLHGTLVIAVVPLAGAAVVLTAVSRFRASDLHAASAARRMESMACEWRPFALFVVMFSLSSGIATGLMTFVPLYLVDDRGATPAAANVMTSVLLAAAAAGTVLGGYVSHRLGRRFVFVVPQLVFVPAIALLPTVGDWAIVPLVAVAGVCSSANMAVAVVSAQEYLPSRMGLATGLTMGVCGGVGGVIVAALGPLGDAAGPAAVLYVLAALPLAVAVSAALLPRPAACPEGTLWGLRASGAR
jgi:FSR family fosmidomycin resistance protein-like MFS transporter